MRILLATVFEYPHIGGLSTHITTLKKGLESEGHEVDVLSFSDLPYYKRQFYAKGPSFGLNIFNKGRGLLVGHYFRQVMLRHMIEKAHRKNPYDLINAQDIYATFASVDTGIPTVSTAHGYKTFEAISRGSVKENSQAARMLTKKEREAYLLTEQVVTVDFRIKNYVKDLAGVDAERIHNFIDVESFVPKTDQCQEIRAKYGVDQDAFIVFVPRRLTKKNGVIYPALAVARLIQRIPNIQLVYAGDGHERERVESIIQSYKLQDYVTLLGDIPHEKMADYYGMSNVTIIPSVHADGVEEATSISALEAMGAGVPVIASKVGGLKEIVKHDETGILTIEKDDEGLANAIERLYLDPSFRSSLAERARKDIEKHYSHTAAAQKYLSIYEGVLNRSAESISNPKKEEKE
ncbi:glycosyltransferase family 4 protein [Alkalibacillus aidingensis]|uniref:glycosyltransferase family 4 protein n=1 Tax=Alkalibacillus aidingensis TaxID=2747607 RepID=UPI0016610FF0|nr:glycosyltransferase family 4 protein [Alkalibacillus aidingensis]